MDGPRLIYFADPMCSWCWGFAPVIEAVEPRYGAALPVRLILGGLRPGTTQPMTPAARAELATHWTHVHEASGQPFDHAFLGRDGFVYDTDPACRAVVAARRQDPRLALPYLRAAQAAFYANNRDVTDAGVLTDLAARLGLDRARFEADLAAEDVKQEAWGDYATSQNAGVRGFPTLIVGPNPDGTFAMVTRGYQPAAPVLATIDAWLASK
ncbi:MAG: DsbA family protein [Pseudomonadota bacterium]